MLCSTLQREDRCRKITVLIIVLIWVIMTIRTGPDWLTPMEIAFCALLLGQPHPATVPSLAKGAADDDTRT